jgi:hypothetical protein
VNAKMLRLGGPAAIQPLWELATRFLFGRPVVDLNGVAPRMLRLRAFLRGAWLGLRLRLDPATGRFVGGDAQAAPARPAAEMSVAGR